MLCKQCERISKVYVIQVNEKNKNFLGKEFRALEALPKWTLIDHLIFKRSMISVINRQTIKSKYVVFASSLSFVYLVDERFHFIGISKTTNKRLIKILISSFVLSLFENPHLPSQR